MCSEIQVTNSKAHIITSSFYKALISDFHNFGFLIVKIKKRYFEDGYEPKFEEIKKNIALVKTCTPTPVRECGAECTIQNLKRISLFLAFFIVCSEKGMTSFLACNFCEF